MAKIINAAGTNVSTPIKEGEQKYKLDSLWVNCNKLFDVSSCVFAGATEGMAGEYTVNEIKETIENWKKKGVR